MEKDIEVMKEIKQRNLTLDTALGVTALLDDCKNVEEGYNKMLEFLRNNPNARQHEIISYAFELSETKPEIYEIED